MKTNILSLSGGGYMGVFSAMILAEIEREHGPLRRSLDLVAGTSIGGIIGLGIASGASASLIAESFSENGVKIFSGRSAPRYPHALAVDILRSVRKAKYDPLPLRGVVESFLGEKSLRDLDLKVVIPSVDVTNGRMHLFRSPGSDPDMKLVDVALATSAAPTIFPLHKIGDAYFADGGVYAQSPDVLALSEAEDALAIPVEDIFMLSIGTTTGHFDFGPALRPSLGIRDWLESQKILRMLWATQQQAAAHVVERRLDDRYLRIDIAQSAEDACHLGLDIASPAAHSRLEDMAKRALGDLPQASRDRLERILQPPPRVAPEVPAPVFDGKETLIGRLGGLLAGARAGLR